MNVIIIDYGMGNLGSVYQAIKKCGAHACVCVSPQDIKENSPLILPGVGAFEDGMDHLKTHGWIDYLKDFVLKKQQPLLGICLGMQLLADKSSEGGSFKGLGLIPGVVEKLKPTSPLERIPHIGWNEFYKKQSSPLVKNIVDGTDFYFVHSYHFIPKKKDDILATTPYCGEFVSAVGHQNIYGVQFHPEKSSKPGFQLIKNFLSLI